MKWKVKFTAKAFKALAKMEVKQRAKILNFAENTLPDGDNPRSQGKALTGNFKGLWRYRVGDYRLICNIQDNQLIILVLELGHRKTIYKKSL